LIVRILLLLIFQTESIALSVPNTYLNKQYAKSFI